MGVKELWKLVGAVGRAVSIESLEHKTLAVDVSIWLTQFVKAMRDEEGQPVRNAHLIGTLRRVCKLLFHGIRPVFVFDGGVPAAKAKLIRKRQQRREADANRAKIAAKKLLAVSLLRRNQQQQETQPFDPGAQKTQENDDDDDDEVEWEAADEDESDDEEAPVQMDVNFDTDALAALSAQMRREAVEAAQSRHRKNARKAYLPVAGDADAYSKTQLSNFLETAKFRAKVQKAQQIAESSSDLGGNRIHSDAHRRYIFEKTNTASAKMRRFLDANPIYHEDMMEMERLNEERELNDFEAGLVDDDDLAGDDDHLAGDQGGGFLVPEPEASQAGGFMPENERSNRVDRSVRPARRPPPNRRPIYHEDMMEMERLNEERELNEIEAGMYQEEEEPAPIDLTGTNRDHADGAQEPARIDLTQTNRDHADDVQEPARIDLTGTNRDSDDDAQEPAPIDLTGTNGHADGAQEPARIDLTQTNRDHADDAQEPAPIDLTQTNRDHADDAQEPARIDLTGTNGNSDDEDAEDCAWEAAEAPSMSVDADAVRAKLQALIRDRAPNATTTTTETIQAAYDTANKLTGWAGAAFRKVLNDSGMAPLADAAVAKEGPAPRASDGVSANVQAEVEEPAQAQAEVEETADAGSDALSESRPRDETQETVALLESAGRCDEASPERPEDETPEKTDGVDWHTTEPKEVAEREGFYAVCPDFDEQLEYAVSNAATADVEGLRAAATAAEDARERRVLEYVVFKVSEKKRESANLEEEMEALRRQARNDARSSDHVTDEMRDDVMGLLRVLGFPYVIAPMEAEAQCAYLEVAGAVEGVVTDDSDALVFGAKRVYKNLFSEKKPIEAYYASDLKKEYGLDRRDLIALALLLGGDYADGVKGVGIVNAAEILTAFKTDASPSDTAGAVLTRFKAWLDGGDVGDGQKAFAAKRANARFKWQPPPGFPSAQAEEAYSTPRVADLADLAGRPETRGGSAVPNQHHLFDAAADDDDDDDDEAGPLRTAPRKLFRWTEPDEDEVLEWCSSTLGWADDGSTNQIRAALEKHRDRMSRPRETRLDAFYDSYHSNTRFAQVVSKRLKRALGKQDDESTTPKKLKKKKPSRKVDAVLDDDDDDREEEEEDDARPTPSRSARRRRAADVATARLGVVVAHQTRDDDDDDEDFSPPAAAEEEDDMVLEHHAAA